jgi:hypothetical protein
VVRLTFMPELVSIWITLQRHPRISVLRNPFNQHPFIGDAGRCERIVEIVAKQPTPYTHEVIGTADPADIRLDCLRVGFGPGIVFFSVNTGTGAAGRRCNHKIFSVGQPTECYCALFFERPCLSWILRIHLFKIAIIIARMRRTSALKCVTYFMRPSAPYRSVGTAGVLAEYCAADERRIGRARTHRQVTFVALAPMEFCRVGLRHDYHDPIHIAPVNAGW